MLSLTLSRPQLLLKATFPVSLGPLSSPTISQVEWEAAALRFAHQPSMRIYSVLSWTQPTFESINSDVSPERKSTLQAAVACSDLLSRGAVPREQEQGCRCPSLGTSHLPSSLLVGYGERDLASELSLLQI